MTVSDTSRAIQHDPDITWPTSVVLVVTWNVNGELKYREEAISADQFFGRGLYGAPIPGEAIIQSIERMRKAGPPAPPPKPRGKNAKTKR
jgi:hypothetical protein